MQTIRAASGRAVPLQLILLTVFLHATVLTGPGMGVEEQAAVPVRAVAVTHQQAIRTTTLPATLEPYYRAEIRAKISGYVREVKAQIGDVVAPNDVLAVLDVPEMVQQADILAARIRRLQAEEARSRAGIQLAAATIRSIDAQLLQAQSLTATDDALLKAATAEADRMQDLVNRGASERRLLDEAIQRRDAAAARRESSLSAITSAEANVAVAKSKQTSAEADLAVAVAETQIAVLQAAELQIMLGYAELKAPFAGVVTSRTINPGDLVNSGSGAQSAQPLFAISQIDKLRCQLQIPERDAAVVQPGDPIAVTFPSFAAEELHATVTRTSQSLDRETRTMLVEAEILNPDAKFLPGMFGQATLTLQAPAAASVLPARAVRFDAKGGALVYRIQEDNTVAVTAVTILSDDGQLLRVSGIDAGQRVIDAHLQRFTDGQRVDVVER